MPLPPPEDIGARLHIAAIRRLIAQARAYERAGKYQVALSLIEPALVAARRSGHGPLEAEALDHAGWIRFRAGDDVGAEQALFAAVVAAAASGHLEVEADARVSLVGVDMRLTRYDEGLRSGELAAALIARLRGDPAKEARLLQLEANILEAKGDYGGARARIVRSIDILQRVAKPGEENFGDGLMSLANLESRLGNPDAAVALYRRALAMKERAFGPDHPSLAIVLNNLGGVLNEQHQLQAALALLTRGLAIRERALGARHLSVAASLINVAGTQGLLGNHDRAVELYRRALDIIDAKDPDHPFAGFAHNDLGVVRASQGAYDDALRETRRGLAIREKVYGPTHDDVGRSLLAVGRVQELLEQDDQALTSYRRAGAIFAVVPGPRSPETALSLQGEGRVLGHQGRSVDALAQLARARAILEEGKDAPSLGANHQSAGGVLARAGRHLEAIAEFQVALADFEHVEGAAPDQAAALAGLGTSFSALGRVSEAQPPLERAVALLEAQPGDPHRLADARFALAQVLWDSRADRPRAIVLARAADAAQGPRMNAARTWLGRHSLR